MNNKEKLSFYIDWWLNLIIRDRAYGIVGVRRSGKTFKLRKIYPKEKVIYINFEEQRLHPLNGKELLDQKCNVSKPFLLLDEIQALPGWERATRTLIDNRMANIIFTGSSPVLAGRTITKIIYPLSFKEFLEFKNVKINYEHLRLLDEYLDFRGFPSEAFVRFLIRSAGSLFSISKVQNTLKSLGFKISKATLLKYLEYEKNIVYPRKIFIVDNGFLKKYEGACFENADDIFYWKNERGEEVDFVLVKDLKPYKLIQVAVDIKDEKTKEREIKALKKASDELKVKAGEEKVNNGLVDLGGRYESFKIKNFSTTCTL